MCVIIYKNQKTDISLNTLENAIKTNPDGLGIAINNGSYWAVSKYLNPTKKDLLSLLKKVKGCDAVFHARIATSGKKDEANIHPFYNNKFLLFHNGVISSLNGIDTEKSDTSLLFDLLTTQKTNKHSLLKALADKTGSRFCLIESVKTDPVFFGNWQEYQGLKCSNLLFVPIDKPVWGCSSKWGRYSYLSKKIYDSLIEQGFNDAEIEDLEQELICQNVDFSKVFTKKHVDDYIKRFKNSLYYRQNWGVKDDYEIQL